MKSGLVIYASDRQPLVNFYVHVFELVVRESEEDYTALISGDFELVVIQAPAAYMNSVTIENPPQARESTPIKPVFFTTEPLADLRARIQSMGGQCNLPEQEWSFNDHVVCDGWDVEGNIFQMCLLKKSLT
ncbi:MAG: hypothetical protein F6K00_25135 [Leptolyngbya sp. SIOISBB]|nr:hypothetical protein [Leptolyngbya sp. SIOISBB]